MIALTVCPVLIKIGRLRWLPAARCLTISVAPCRPMPKPRALPESLGSGLCLRVAAVRSSSVVVLRRDRPSGDNREKSVGFGGSLPPDASRYRWLPAARCPNLALSLSHLVRDFVRASPPSGRHPSSSSDATDLRATTAKRRSRAATQGLSPGNATVTSDVEGRIEAIVPSKCTW